VSEVLEGEVIAAARTIAKLTSRSFRSRLKRAVTEGERIVTAQQAVARRMIEFAESVNVLWLDARQLDREQKSSTHTDEMKDRLAFLTGSDDKGSISQWVNIGKQADKLEAYADNVPPQKDSLYQLSVAVKKQLPVSDWIADNRLTVSSTVREVRALRQGKRRAATNTNRNRVVLELTGSDDDCVLTLVAILKQSNIKTVRLPAHLKDQVLSLVDGETSLVA
jgi:hypothetical protein